MSEPAPTLPDFDALWDYDHPQETEAKFRALLTDTAVVGDLPYRLELSTQIARTEGLQRRFDDAHRTLDEVESLLGKDWSRARIRYLLERGRVLNSSGDRDGALPRFVEAWEMALALEDDALAVDAAHMAAIAAHGEVQMEWNLKAFDLAERSDNPQARKWLGSLSNNIGWTLHGQEKYAEALTMFEKALAFRREQGAEGPIRIAQWCVARTLRSLGRVDEALAAQREQLQKFEADNSSSGYVHEEIAECLLLLGKSAEAQPHFALAHELLSQDPWLVAQEAARLQRLQELGQLPSAQEE